MTLPVADSCDVDEHRIDSGQIATSLFGGRPLRNLNDCASHGVAKLDARYWNTGRAARARRVYRCLHIHKRDSGSVRMIHPLG
jgi:hypothetical protein